jgi:protein SCO1/2
MVVAVGILGWRFVELAERGGAEPLPPPATPADLYAGLGGDFTLTDGKGEVYSSAASLRGYWGVIYFGYTMCPDICGLSVYRLTEAVDRLKDREFMPIFITLDPARDTLERLQPYLDSFSTCWIGLTGTEEQVDAVAGQFHVYAHRNPPDEDGQYTVDHSSFFYVISPEGKTVAALPHTLSVDALTAELEKLMGAGG